jgi:putative protease
MAKRYAPVITGNVSSAGPGHEKAPFPQIAAEYGAGGKKGGPFPEGLYVAVARPEDLYVVQSSRPERVMLPLTRKNIKYLLADNKPPLPFNPGEIIVTLEPYFPQETNSDLYQYGSASGTIAEAINLLIEKGYKHYMVNNPGHFSLFRGQDTVRLIAGPWLYMFNSWALSFIASLGADAFVSPLENNRQNLERTLGIENRSPDSENKNTRGKKRNISSLLHSKFFITVFAWPPLFTIRANLGHVFNDDSFADNKDELFSLAAGPEGSRVCPKEPFSIIDKIPFLKEAGFARFIIDLSGPVLKKTDYRNLMRHVKESAPLPHSNRFNWKNGFFSPS